MFQSPSLRGSGRFRISTSPSSPSRTSFNPLHCGAVVASRRERRLNEHGSGCFNPLHCGAVVASRKGIEATKDEDVFQSPSLRGSGRFF